MSLKDYEVNPYAVGAGGLLGAGLGIGAYLLGNKRSKARLATYATIGAALGLGTGALTTLARKKTEKQLVEEHKQQLAKDVLDSELARTASNVPALIDLGGGVAGVAGGRLAREKFLVKPGHRLKVQATAAQYIPETAPTPGVAAKPEVPAKPAVIKLNGRTLSVDPNRVDLSNMKDFRKITDTEIAHILESNGVDLEAEGLKSKKGRIQWDPLHKFRNDRMEFVPATDYKPATAATDAQPAKAARLLVGEVDYAREAKRLFGNNVDLSKLSTDQVLQLVKHVRKLDYIGPGSADRGSARSKVLRYALGAGGRKRGKSAALAALDLLGGAAGYFGTKTLQDKIRDWF